MDKYKITVDTFDRRAKSYQDKYLNLSLYDDTYEVFCNCIDNEAAQVLDAACGPGNVTKYILSKRPTFKILGIDLAPTMIELAQANNPQAEFRVWDCRSIASLGTTFDAIICAFGLPYLSQTDAEQFIQHAAKLLAPQGVLYLSGMVGDNKDSGFQENSVGDKVYLYFHDTTHLLKALESAGFDSLDVRYKEGPAQSNMATRDFFIIAKLNASSK